MPLEIKYKNLWGSAAEGGIDQQRADLFKFQIVLPGALAAKWEPDIQFAVSKFPFPEAKVETIPVKYLQQVNKVIGADQALQDIEVPVRYAFNKNTAETLWRWFYAISNPRTGGVGLTTAVKARGTFSWLVPNMAVHLSPGQAENENAAVLKEGGRWTLEGCLISGLKMTDADMEATGTSSLVNMNFMLSIDRVYPEKLSTLRVS